MALLRPTPLLLKSRATVHSSGQAFKASSPASRRGTRGLAQHHHLRIMAAKVDQQLESRSPQSSALVQDRMEFLRKDLPHLFDNQGIDKDAYEEVVEFIDPITRYNKLSGYLFNIQFLRRIFDPTFTLHDLQQSGPNDITTRWTMRMEFALSKGTPLRKWWNPTLIFTGVSIMTVNPETGKFVKHIDLWDSVENQRYFSWEAFSNVLGQLGDLTRTPSDLDTPSYMVMKKFSGYEIRRYEPFVVAEVPLDVSLSSDVPSSASIGASSGQVNPAKGSGGAFNALAGYIFGGNSRNEKMAMTMPVFSDSTGRMQFVVRSSGEGLESLPSPERQDVQLKRQPGGHFAAIMFNGVADEDQVSTEVAKLRRLVAEGGLSAADDSYVLARYNDPSTKPRFRRNEVLIELKSFQLW